MILYDTTLLAGELTEAGAAIAIDPREVDAFAQVLGQVQADDDLCRKMSIAAFDRTAALANTPEGWIDNLPIHSRARLNILATA